MSTTTNSWNNPANAPANGKDSADLSVHLANLAVDDYTTPRQAQLNGPVYPNVHSQRPPPFTPYDGPAPFLYYPTGCGGTPQYPYDLSSQMPTLASAVAAGMYDPYPTPPDNYSPDRSSVSSTTPSNFQPMTSAFQPQAQTPAFQPQTPAVGAARVNAQVYRPPHIQQQMAVQNQGYFGGYDERGTFWARDNGTRHRPMNSSFSSGRARSQNQFSHDYTYLPTPLTPALTGPGQFSLPAYGPPPYVFKNRRHVSADEAGVVRSQRLEDFRQRRNTRLEFSDIYGSICEFAGDQHGSRFIQNKLESATPEERAKVFEEIMPSAYTLMTDVFGNYVIQKMFQFGDAGQVTALAKKMEGHVLLLSTQMYGCRVMQKALEYVQLEQREKLVSELDGHIIDCVKSSNANHVIQRLISLNPPKELTDAFKGHVQELSSHPFGCRVLQKSFEVLSPVKLRPLLDEMHKCSLTLMFDQFGNYVVQSVISAEPGRESDRDKVIAQMKTRIFEREYYTNTLTKVSRHKFASNVVERAIRLARPSDRRAIIAEMLEPDRIPILLRDSFGNFTVQTALNEADVDQRDLLLGVILPLMPTLRHTPCGRRLEAKINEYESIGVLPQSESEGEVSSVDGDGDGDGSEKGLVRSCSESEVVVQALLS